MEKNILREANILFHRDNFDEALLLYRQAQQVFPELHESLELVINYTKRQRSENVPSKVSVQPVNRDRFGNIIREKVVIDENDPRLELVKPASLEEYFFEQIVESQLFDPHFYLSQYYDELVGVDNLLENYLTEGIKQKRNPSNHFDTAYYLKHNPDVAQADVNPFLHYVGNGIFEGREAVPKPYDSPYEVAPVEYIERLPLDETCAAQAVRTICFYLPQFHAIPENDEWWGKGFTEWTNVKPAKPQFEGHYQPHVPDDFLGYYNLLEKETQRKQIELAKQYGIEGFCYYLYWFSGQRLLEQPLDNMLADKTLDFPFCVCWANENWSRRWDGLDNDLLMVQDYSPGDDIAFIENTAKYLKDKRYIRINGKPLLMIYRPNLFPDMKATARRWRNWCRENGVGEIYLAYPQSFESVPPEEYDFDAAVEFPPNKSNPPNITEFQTPVVEDFQSTVYDWRVFMERSEKYQDPGYTLFRGITPSWDNTARKKNKGTVFQNSCPSLFEQKAVRAFTEVKRAAKSKDEEIVFVNAWNEWAEGAHLEPDQKYGYAWLQALKNAHEAVLKKKNSILLVSHDAHPHGAQVLCLNMAKELSLNFHFRVEILVLGEGNLIPKFKKYGNVTQVHLHIDSQEKVTGILENLRESGVDKAIVNTAVSGAVSSYLKKAGLTQINLIHELPKVLAQYDLHDQVSDIIKYSDEIIFPAQQVKDGFEEFSGKGFEQWSITPQGLFQPSILRKGETKATCKRKLIEQYRLPENARIMLNVAYADYRKGFDLFVETACELFTKHDNLYAIWVGHQDGALVSKSLEIAEKLGFKERFILTNGYVDNPQIYYAGADIFALTSREDPFPSVVLESLDAETPIVAFRDCGGFENLLNRECGLLADKESVSSFASCVEILLTDEAKAKKLASTGKALIDKEFRFHHYIFDLLEKLDIHIPKVSVIVPNYNYADYIEERLESIFKQNYPIYEVIVLDDNSTDNSVDVIQNYLYQQEFPTKLVVNKVNSGSVFKQWERGAELATGDLIWMAEADDLAAPDFLNKLTDLFIKDKELVLAYSQSKQIDQDGKLLSNDYLEYTADLGEFWQQDFIVDGQDEIKRGLCVKNTIPNVSGALFNRIAFKKSIEKLKYSLSEYRVAGDWLIYVDLLQTGKLGFIAESLNLHRRHISSVTKVNDHMEEIKKVQSYSSNLVEIPKEMMEKVSNYNKVLEVHFSGKSEKHS
jgi:glycosyltransferase involved in cell wall biosynthesis